MWDGTTESFLSRFGVYVADGRKGAGVYVVEGKVSSVRADSDLYVVEGRMSTEVVDEALYVVEGRSS